MMSMMQLRTLGSYYRCMLLWVLAAIAACASFPPVAPVGGGPPRGSTTERHPSDHVQAATQYENLAAARSGAEQVELLLAAAREWLAAARAADATRALAAIKAPQSPAQSLEHALLGAEVLLASSRPQEAWQQISAIAEPSAANVASRYDLLKMRIAIAAARPVDAVRAEMAAERFTSSAAERTQLHAQLFSALRAARDRGVRLDAQASPDLTVRGWLELGAIAPEARGASLAGTAELARWRARYANHPAQDILAAAFPPPLTTADRGGGVALLLPLTGAAASQAGTVRDGFLSAYYQLPAASRPDLRLYDTGALTPADAIAQARAAGSSFIVGPLTREDVAAVAALGNQSIPVLALNFLPADRPAPGGMYQFALSPEEEAQLVARRILADGHHRGIALVPRGDWGTRVIDAFTRELLAGGGSLISAASYDSAGHDYGVELESVLRVSDSEARHQRLQTVLGTKLNFEPRHRADIEFVFIVPESATNARLMAPQLKYYYAGDIPSYSLSIAYDSDSTDANRDIDGLRYPDMPWMVSGDSSIDAIRSSVEQAWGSRVAWRSRLFAFGYDACQLMLALSSAHNNAAAVQVAGLTGQLHIDGAGRVERALIWVQIRDGEPRRLSADASAAPDTP
jgi:outer membrane PBP1 activator LpoA protein